MSKKKVEDILNWPAPRNVKEVQKFIGFANFYYRFIHGFSSLTLPIQILTLNGVLWKCKEECQNASEELKNRFITATILCHYHPDRHKQIETDASDLCKAGILSQYQPDNRWHPLACINKRFLPADLNYDVHDKEMVVIVNCFMAWRHFLTGSPQQIVVYADHKNLEYFNTTKILNRRQARWAEILSEFNSKIVYRPGEKNGKTDAISHWVDPELEGEGEKQDLTIQIFKPGQFDLGESEELLVTRQVMAVKALQTEEFCWSREILEAGLLDSDWSGIRNALVTGQSYKGLEHYGLEDDLVSYERHIYVPESNALKLKVTNQCHDAKVAGHFGRDKTLQLMKWNYYWPNIEEGVPNWVRTCDACQRNKTARHKKYGKLVPLGIPSRPWEQISMDFITDLPNAKGYNQCWVIGDRFTKMAHFFPLKNRKAKKLALAFVRQIWRLHGLPKRVVSARNTVFMSSFWTEVMRLIEVEQDKSSA